MSRSKSILINKKYFQSTMTYCKRRVVVTGIGIVCPLGTNKKTAWKNLLEGRSGILQLKDNEYAKLPCRIAGVIPHNEYFDKKLSKINLKTMAPATALALIATEEALSDAKWFPESADAKEQTGVALGIGMIDLKDVCDTNKALQEGYNKVSPYFVPRILPNMAAGHVSIKYGFRGPNHAVSTACATGAHAIGDAFRFIQHGDANVMICGGAEACISPLAIAGFCRLRALSTSFNENPTKASRPFDQDREGFVMGEGAAVLILEERMHALNRNAHIYSEILGYGLSGDASHLTAPKEDGSGAILSMQRALRDAHITTAEVTYINAHATSTPIGDGIESKAIKTLFHDNSQVAVSSTKGAHGHLLGAAGNLEIAFTALACKYGELPPTINLETPIDDIHYIRNETQQQSKQWVEVSGSAPKKAKSIASAGKVMASVFWDAKGILLIDYLEKGRTITGKYYSNLDQLDVKIHEKKSGLKKKKIIYHQDNAPAHKSVLAMGKLQDLLGYPPLFS